MRRVVVTPATDVGLVARLYQCLLPHKADFDEWRVWVSTDDQQARDALVDFAAQHEWIVAIDEGGGPGAQTKMYRTCRDVGTLYARLDERLSWLSPAFLSTLFGYLREYTVFFLVFPSVQGNPFFDTHPTGALNDRPIVRMDAFAWHGSEFDAFQGRVPEDEATWLCRDRPFRLGKYTAVCGDAVCVLGDTPTPAAVVEAVQEASVEAAVEAAVEDAIDSVVIEQVFTPPSESTPAPIEDVSEPPPPPRKRRPSTRRSAKTTA